MLVSGVSLRLTSIECAMVTNGSDSSRANGVYISKSNMKDKQFKQELATNVKSLSQIYVWPRNWMRCIKTYRGDVW
jgi:hypothetical protein